MKRGQLYEMLRMLVQEPTCVVYTRYLAFDICCGENFVKTTLRSCYLNFPDISALRHGSKSTLSLFSYSIEAGDSFGEAAFAGCG
jgi:hypothetical protein